MGTKRFLKGYLAICSSLAAAMLALVACAKKTQGSENPLAALPEQLSLISVLRVDKALEIDDLANILRDPKSQAELARLTELGVSPADIAVVLWAMNTETEELCVISFKKSIKLDTIIKKATGLDKNSKVITEDIGGRTLYLASGSRGGGSALVQIQERLVAIGSPALVRKCIDATDGKARSVLSNQGLMALCENGRRGEIFWMAGVFPKDSKSFSLGSIMIAADYDKELRLNGTVTCLDPNSAALASSFLSSFKFIALSADIGMKEEQIKSKVEGSKLSIEIKIAKDSLAELLALAQRSPQQTPPIASEKK